MLLQFYAVDRLEVTGERLCLHRVHDGVALLDSLGWVSSHEAEVLEILAVCCRELEVRWYVTAQPAYKRKEVASTLLGEYYLLQC